MKTYIKFLSKIFLNSFFYVSLVMFSLIFILNLLSELDFFKDIKVDSFFPIYLSLLNSPTFIFEMFPFIFLISTQLFFITLFNNNQLSIFKYSGLKNSNILIIISLMSFFLGILIITLFYSFSSSLKNFYLDLKTNYTKDGKYLAVITKNGLWIKDVIDNKILIINSFKIDKNYLIDAYISEFNNNFEIKRNIVSPKIDISDKNWVVYDAEVFDKNKKQKLETLEINTNFDYLIIQNLFSNLSSLSILELLQLRKNYKSLNYSIIEIDIQLLKLISFPLYLVLMTVLSSIIMLSTKKLKSSILKISIGLFFSVVIYYLFNFFNVLGKTEKINIFSSVLIPIILLTIINSIIIRKFDEK
ncbi:LptF/LptG family permease [Candidatus Pelagibacter sp.]|nr:LptF/LptG family permease [Candidatus Pelagibacter sp.]